MRVTVTAGHGGGDPGATYAGLTEADLMAGLRDVVATKLRAAGHVVRTDGEGKVNRALSYALTLIPGSGIAVDLHTNAFSNPSASGVEVVAKEGMKVPAQRLARAVAAALGLGVRGEAGWIPAARSQHSRLAYLTAGGMILETFFLSNPMDLASFLHNEDAVARAIASTLTEGSA